MTKQRAGLYTALTLLAVLFLIPMIWGVSSAFKARSDIFEYPPRLFPAEPTLENFRAILDGQPFWSWLLVSTLVALVSTAVAVFLCCLAGFGFAKYQFRFKNALFDVLISSLAVPFAVIIVPLFILLAVTGTLNVWFALIVPWVAPAFGIFMMRQYVEQSVPDELLHAARIDGAGEFRIFLSVVLPLLRPAVGALAVWNFLNSYNSFLWPLIVVSDPDQYTLPLGLQALFGAEGRQYDLVLAGSVLAAIPSLIVFFVLRKQLLDGLTAGAVK
ncbi:carbohydrate ABC transporter permease [Kineosporia babensis]|uniref:Carbohydrate ABC transporter permease n=1 Tax=Kineosporia babensis TaxID=499548 RepID=A0A9X1NHR3_9ACTN|nr:carbohydrate ABC transporter permease [Kineosporia babensis]MCD5314363.1 carbohydrate ABC transporter permease [Kineosporia babensis]